MRPPQSMPKHDTYLSLTCLGLCCHSSHATTGTRMPVVSLLQKAPAKQAAAPKTAASPLLREAAQTMAPSSHTVVRLSNETIRWYQMSSGLSPNSKTAAEAEM